MNSPVRLWLVIVALVSAVAGVVSPVVAAPRDTVGHWAQASITRLLAKGLVEGLEDGSFRPDEPVTRAQFVRMLLGVMGRTGDALMLGRVGGIFADVPAEHPASADIAVAYEFGLARGRGDRLFSPEAPIQRCELTALLVRAAGREAEAIAQDAVALPFRDAADVPHWASGYVAVAVRLGLIIGMTEGSFRPLARATRAEAAVFLCRLMCELGLWPDDLGVFHGYDAAGGLILLRQAGGIVAFPLSVHPFVYRNEAPVEFADLTGLDEVFLTTDNAGKVAQVEARLIDMLGTVRSFDRDSLAVSFLPRGGANPVELVIPPEARVFLNGKPADREALAAGDRLYVVLDSRTGAVRVADAVRVTHRGRLVGREGPSRRFVLLVEGAELIFEVDPRAVVFLDGAEVPVEDLAPGDLVLAVVDERGVIEYLEAVRGGNESP